MDAAYDTVVDGVVMLTSLAGEFMPVALGMAGVIVGWTLISHVFSFVLSIGRGR